MKINPATSFLLPLLFFLSCLNESVNGRPLLLSLSRPKLDDSAIFARWLVSQSSWGVLNTIASDMGGAPFGNVVSFSDGLPDKGRGIPYFYLTTLDPTASNALKDQRSSFTISEYPIGTCGKTDPENPTCAKITLIGKLKLLNGDPKETSFAQTALFTKHPEMKGWPKSHNFQIFKLEIEQIFMINWFGGPKPLTVDQYLQAKMFNWGFKEEMSRSMTNGEEEEGQWKNPTTIYSRKDKSLGLLCSNFLKLCDREGVDTIGLDNAADQLGVERRRIYDIVNILESIGVLSRKAKNQYRWNGFNAIPLALDSLKKEGSRDQCTESSTSKNAVNVIDWNNSDLKEKELAKTSESHKNDNRKEKSLMLLAQNFVKLFQCSDADLISFDKAASALLGDIHDSSAMKTKTRRLYDIANVFASMNLIEKIRCPDNGKPAFRWIGWKGNPRRGSPAAPKADDSTRRTFGTELTNKIPKRCRADSSSDLMSNGQVKRFTLAKDDALKDKNKEMSTVQHNEHGTKDFVFGPFGPTSLPKSAVPGKENLKQTRNWEELASEYHPQYQNKDVGKIFAHYVEAWESWYVKAAEEQQKQKLC